MIAECDKPARGVEAALEEVEPGRPIEIMLDVVLAVPEQLDRRAGLLGDPGGLGHEIVAQTPAEAAADPRHIDGDVALGDSEGRRNQLGAGPGNSASAPRGRPCRQRNAPCNFAARD